MFELSVRRVIVLCVLVVSLLSGCSMLAPTPEPVTISFVYPDDPTGSFERWADEFHERYPYITVELAEASGVHGDPGATHDAFVATQFELGEYLKKQSIADLSGFIEQDEEVGLDDFYPAALNVFRSQGRQWALPFGIDMMMTYYNKDLFDRYNVPYPQVGWTWRDFLDRAVVLTDPDADIYGFALQYNGNLAIFEPVMMIYQHGGRIFDDLQSPTRVTLDDPLNIEAMDFYVSLIYDHHVAPIPEEVQRYGRAYPWRGILDGKFGMWTMMFSERGGRRWPKQWEINWGIVPMPRDQTAASLALADGLFVSSKSEHPNEAWLWISFLSHELPPFQMPARQSLAESPAYEDLVGQEVAVAARAGLSDAILVNPDLLGFEKALGAMATAFDQIRKGEATPEEALTTAQEQSGF